MAAFCDGSACQQGTFLEPFPRRCLFFCFVWPARCGGICYVHSTTWYVDHKNAAHPILWSYYYEPNRSVGNPDWRRLAQKRDRSRDNHTMYYVVIHDGRWSIAVAPCTHHRAPKAPKYVPGKFPRRACCIIGQKPPWSRPLGSQGTVLRSRTSSLLSQSVEWRAGRHLDLSVPAYCTILWSRRPSPACPSYSQR